MKSHDWDSASEDGDVGAAASGAHDWEDAVHAPPSDHDWDERSASASEVEGFGQPADSCSEDEMPQTPSAEFISYCTQMLNLRTITYRDFCIIMYWAGKAGVAIASKLGLRPDSPNGHYARKCNMTMPESADAIYSLEIPGHRKADLSRTLHENIVLAPHELLATDIAGLAGLRTQLVEAIESNSLPPSYYDHVVVTRNPTEHVWPISLFVDGVPYSQVDSVIGLWLVNMVNGQRYLFATSRNKFMCRCGCKGWCSLFAMFRFLRW